jgi:nitroimidazol reductase NimA-like FMN-containing flavoprotein (pyridoxamine 5'-phosphate oxidase superfamily)
MYEVEKILAGIKFCNLATVCEDGQPWNTPVFFVWDGENFYWWSNRKAVHSQNIARNPRIFITVYDSTLPEDQAKAAYFQASAKMLEDKDEILNATELYNQRAKSFQLDAKVTGGEAPTRLYAAKPEKIWLNGESEENGYYVDVRKLVK